MKKIGLALCLIWLCACSKEDDSTEKEVIRQEYRIAVVLPLEGTMGDYWRKPINWSLENLNKTLAKQRQIKITLEWFDENQPDIKGLFGKLAEREDIAAIIGPLYSKNANIAAQQCHLRNKMLIPPTISSEMIMRKYASSKGFLWCLTENDISQCEVLLTCALRKGAKSVSLLTSDDEYGTTFWDWFAFQAQELGLEIRHMEQYNDADVVEKMSKLLLLDTDCLICVPRTQEITVKMNECRRKQTQARPFLLFSDVAYITPKDASFEGMEGTTQTYDPQSGFAIEYEAKFGEAPGYGSAQFFDAVTLAGLSILRTDLGTGTDINQSLRGLVNGAGEEINTASSMGIDQAVQSLIAGQHPHLSGASGKLNFDQSVYTNVTHSIFCHWQVRNGKHQIQEYNTSDSQKRTNDAMANWNWETTNIEKFEENAQISYLPKEGLYAIIIATSHGWDNYRHQANAYAVYQLLKKNGMTDDHILLISEDDISYHSSNPTPGFIQSPVSGNNLYSNVQLDYRPSELPFEEMMKTFETNFSRRPGKVDNLFIYWAGHGEPEGPKWLDKTISAEQVADFLKQLSDNHYYRKLFLAIETCYSGRVGMACADRNIAGLLCMAAANDKETSKTSKTNASGDLWISNSFTDNLLEQLSTAGDKLTIYDLYHKVYSKTMGSHVSVYNSKNVNSLYTTRINEFIYP